MKSPRKPVSSSFSFQMALPRGYTSADAMHFHGRDKEGISEVVTDLGLRKGILLDDVPTAFDIVLEPSNKRAVCTVSADGQLTEAMQAQARDIVPGLLGLRLDPKGFAAFVAADPVFGPLARKQKTLRIVQSSSVYEALTWAVMGQQINVSFAVTLRRTFIQLAGRRHSSGLWCYPSPADAARLPIEALTTRQYSRSKAETVLRLSTLIANGDLDIVESASNTVESICAALLAVKGIGPWTVNYALLRGYAQPDCSLHGDVAVRSAIGRLCGLDARPGIAAAEAFLKRYSPHRTMAAAHLWASLNTQKEY
ncbi:DNA-3-methyladenine glycosylase family protein [Achromobacter aloeverae]|nr:DNA-3-methyladenine glycosylase 2 [Achromobacter aloeverae]